ncbi:MAG TPA: O-antigen ligase family protein, partial [Albitalea sp.]|nr:O-antigen ligase family protein [Albitalea sp.]
AWALLGGALLVLSVARPVWAVALYFQTFFALPQLWWWGDELPRLRYSLWSGYILLAAALIAPRALIEPKTIEGKMKTLTILMLVNATFVHLLLAPNRTISLDSYVEMLKYVLLMFLMSSAIKDKTDFQRAVAAMALGAAYIGWEVTVNGRGDFSGSRLEGVGAPGASTANSLANLMLVVLPLAGSLFLQKSWRWKLTCLVAAPLILNVLLLCNSRGAFLGLIGTGIAFAFLAKGTNRKKALKTLGLAAVALYLLLGDARILDRFMTTFTGSEQRDNSAASRLVFWNAGLRLLNDHPLGAGGGAFKFALGQQYLAIETGDTDADSRSLHNGYLTEATDWGVQGLILKLWLILVAIRAAYRTTERCRREQRTEEALLGLCVVTMAVGHMIHCFFGSFFDHEWTYWILALLARYSDLYEIPEAQTKADPSQAERLPQPVAAA